MIYDKRYDYDFGIVNYPFLDGDFPRRVPCGVYISQLMSFARVCNHVADLNARNKMYNSQTSPEGLFISLTSKNNLKMLSETLRVDFLFWCWSQDST